MSKRSYGQTGIALRYNSSQAMAERRAAARRRKQGSNFVMGPGPMVVKPGFTRTVGAYKRSIPGNIEKKYYDATITQAADSSAGVIIPSLNLIAQGTTDQLRIGNKVNIRNINLKIHCYMDNQVALQPVNGMWRMILYVDKQCNGATAAVTDILKTADWQSFRNMDQVDRFIILKDKVYQLPVYTRDGSYSSQADRFFRMSKRMFLPVHFSSTTGAITEIRSNNIGLLLISSASFENTQIYFRTKFTDE